MFAEHCEILMGVWERFCGLFLVGGMATARSSVWAWLAAAQRAVDYWKQSEKHGYRRSGKITDFFGMPLPEYVKGLRSAEVRWP